ncbi:cytochrome c [Celeribacter arenosi]|uniref:Cytochrome c n=1 Tax=Celeribacter arenosi TaxID=792649 RepID=A0ABP7JZ92_9RHOB
MQKIVLATALVISATFGVMARADVENPAVMARMDAMKTIGGSLKTLGDMAKGAVAFDAAAANAALDAVEQKAAAVPALFEAQETDPESEAKPEIWTNWEDFVAKSKALEMAAAGATITDQASIGAAMGALGGTCKACHSDYRM